MNFNKLLFPAPNKSYTFETLDLFFVPRAPFKNNVSNFQILNPADNGIKHIPCAYIQNQNGSSKVVLLFHSNGEDLGQLWSLMESISEDWRVHVVAMEYPSYGVYPGSPSCEQISDDALNVYDYLTNEMEWEQKDIILVGRSIGTGFATHVASLRNPGMLILISAFLSIKSVIKNFACIASFLISDRLKNIEIISKVKCPKVFVHGEDDQLVPAYCSEELYQESSSPKKLVINPDMDHDPGNIYKQIIYPVLEFWKSINFKTKPDRDGQMLEISNTEIPIEYKKAKSKKSHWSCN